LPYVIAALEFMLHRSWEDF